jgi:hypothetical protein
VKLQPHHPYTANYEIPADPYTGARACTCGRARKNEVHDLAPVPQDVLDAEARRFGETTD